MEQFELQPDSVVCAADIWWQHSDVMFKVVATTASSCRKLAMQALRDQKRVAKAQAAAEDEVEWSGVYQVIVYDLPVDGYKRDEAIGELNTHGYCYINR
jgi:hypothetical protein